MNEVSSMRCYNFFTIEVCDKNDEEDGTIPKVIKTIRGLLQVQVKIFRNRPFK